MVWWGMSKAIWFNGELVNELYLPATNSSWLVGDGFFETIKTHRGQCFFLDKHLERLINSLTAFSLTSVTREDLEKAVSELLAVSTPFEFGRLRITIFADGQSLITHQEILARNHPVELCRYPHRRASFANLAGHKTISYMENFAALRFATSRQCDDVLFLNELDQVTESAVANLIYYREGGWYTPSLASGCLPGITRGLLVENFGVQERDLSEQDIPACEALALTSSLREIVEVKAYEGKLYPSFKPLQQLQASFNAWARDKLSK